jgi:NitT/TauT family transport system ATP-binding protein
MAQMNELAVDIARKRFPASGRSPALTALEDVHFTVSRGRLACLLGPSGCGKTTLLNIVAGLDRDYDGQVMLPRTSPEVAPVLGYVFQTPRLLPWRTVEENIGLVLRPDAERGVIDDLLALTDLDAFRHAYPERLSVGMSRRAALARAFAVEPDLLLMDEPFVSLDEPTAQRLRRTLLDLWRRRPTTILFVTHDTREALQLADRLIRLTPSPGRIEAVNDIDLSRDERGDPTTIEQLRRRLFGGEPAPGR